MSARGKSWTAAACLRTARLLLPLAVFAGAATVLVFVGPERSLALRGEETSAPERSDRSPSDDDDPNQSCLRCHQDRALTITFPSDEALSLQVDAEVFQGSAHGDWLDCIDCHQANRRYPHPLPEFATERDYARAQYEVCKRCHFDNYTRTLDSIHFEAMAEGEANAPICTDCHEAHTMTPLHESRLQVVETCSKCHDEIYNDYGDSVHGSALQEENPDVPDCVTCHGVHNIPAANSASFRQQSVDLCASCHGNKELMDKYDISSSVIKTYLDDFHGKTVGFYQNETSEIWPEVAVCTDCHGVHDIKEVGDPDSPVIKENLVETCRKCHEDATSKFPSAWLSHYEASLHKSPLVFLAKRFYQVLIPLMVGGLAFNVALDMWRLARNR
jgi:predicted CXXCH cytochrome family protein